jgi:hypothetical protein
MAESNISAAIQGSPPAAGGNGFYPSLPDAFLA